MNLGIPLGVEAYWNAPAGSLQWPRVRGKWCVCVWGSGVLGADVKVGKVMGGKQREAGEGRLVKDDQFGGYLGLAAGLTACTAPTRSERQACRPRRVGPPQVQHCNLQLVSLDLGKDKRR